MGDVFEDIPIVGDLTQGIFGSKGKTGLLGTGGYEVAVDPYYNEKTKQLADYLLMQSQGQTPSIAAEQSKQALLQNLLDQQAGIRSIGGISGALKQRMIANSRANTGTDIANQGAQLELQERQGARNLLADVLLGKNRNDISEEGLKLNEQQERAKRRGEAVKAGGEALASAFGPSGGKALSGGGA